MPTDFDAHVTALLEDIVGPADSVDVAAAERRVTGRVARRRRRRYGRRAGAAVVAAMLVVGVVRTAAPHSRRRELRTVVPPAIELPSGGTWQSVSAPPGGIAGRPMVTVGNTVLAFGTDTGGTRTGAAFDGETRQWRRIADAPFDISSTSAVAAGSAFDAIFVLTINGFARYDVQTNAWQSLPPPPFPLRDGSSITGDEDRIVVWGGYKDQRHGSDGANDGAVYDIANKTWQTLPAAPLRGRFYNGILRTGNGLIVFGGSRGDGAGVSQLSDGAAWDQTSNSWRALPKSPLRARDSMFMDFVTTRYHDGTPTDDAVLIWGGRSGEQPAIDGALLIDREPRRWRSMAPIPAGPDSDPTTVLVGNRLIVVRGTRADLYDPIRNLWTRVADAPAGVDRAVSLDGGALVGGPGAWNFFVPPTASRLADTDVDADPSLPLGDGDHLGFIRPAGDDKHIAFNVAQMFSERESAIAAAEEDGGEYGDDYYSRDFTPAYRRLQLAPDATFAIHNDRAEAQVVPRAVFFARFETDEIMVHVWFDVIIHNGLVTRVAYHFTP